MRGGTRVDAARIEIAAVRPVTRPVVHRLDRHPQPNRRRIIRGLHTEVWLQHEISRVMRRLGMQTGARAAVLVIDGSLQLCLGHFGAALHVLALGLGIKLIAGAAARAAMRPQPAAPPG